MFPYLKNCLLCVNVLSKNSKRLFHDQLICICWFHRLLKILMPRKLIYSFINIVSCPYCWRVFCQSAWAIAFNGSIAAESNLTVLYASVYIYELWAIWYMEGSLLQYSRLIAGLSESGIARISMLQYACVIKWSLYSRVMTIGPRDPIAHSLKDGAILAALIAPTETVTCL